MNPIEVQIFNLYEKNINLEEKLILDLLIENIDINSKNGENDGFINLAISHQHINIVKFLLNKGADLNTQNKNGDTPLHIAIRFGNLSIINSILENVDINILNSKNETPLIKAIKEQNLANAKFLIEKGARINFENQKIPNPLITAIIANNYECVEILIESGADLNFSNYDKSPLAVAINRNNYEIAKLLYNKGAKINYYDSKGNTPLHVAIKEKNYFLVDIFTQEREYVNIYNKNSNTPLNFALSNNSEIEIIKLLVNRGADVNLKNEYGVSPLHKAILLGSPEIVELLVDKGANVNDEKWYGFFPLHDAVMENNVDIVKILVHSGAKIDVFNWQNNTPLDLAFQKKNIEIVRILLAKNTEKIIFENTINIINENYSHEKKLYLIKKLFEMNNWEIENNIIILKELEINCIDIFEYVYQNGISEKEVNQNTEDVLFFAIKNDLTEIVKFLTKLNYGIDYRDENGNSILHYAYFYNKEYINYFLDLGISPDVQNVFGTTILHLAVDSGNIDIINNLLKYNANINIQNAIGETPLCSGLNKMKHSFNNNVFDLLISKNADINIHDNKGKTAISYLIEYNKHKLIDIINKHGKIIYFNIRNHYLHDSVRCSSLDWFDFLIDKGADIKSLDNYNNTILHIASGCSYHDLNKFISLDKSSINQQNLEGETPLHIALKEYQEKHIHSLLENGAEVNIQNNSGDTPLHLAVRKGSYDISNLLIQRKADINIENNLRDTPFHIAFHNKDKSILLLMKLICEDILINNKNIIDINELNTKYVEPIIYLLKNDHGCEKFDHIKIDIAQLKYMDIYDKFIENYFCLINLFDADDVVKSRFVKKMLKKYIYNKLIIYSKSKELNLGDIEKSLIYEKIESLFEFKDNFKIIDYPNEPIIDIVIKWNNDMLDNEFILEAVKNDDINVLEIMFNRNAVDVINNSDALDFDYEDSPIAVAFVNGSTQTVDLFIDLLKNNNLLKYNINSDLCSRDNEGASPLHLTLINENFELAVKLIQNGADPVCNNSDQNSSDFDRWKLSPGMEFVNYGWYDMVEYMLEEKIEFDSESWIRFASGYINISNAANVAWANRDEKMIELFDRYYNPEYYLEMAVNMDDVEYVKKAIREGAKPVGIGVGDGFEYETFFSVFKGDEESQKLLLAHFGKSNFDQIDDEYYDGMISIFDHKFYQ